MLLLLLRATSAVVTAPRTYPLAGVAQAYPLVTAQAYPLAGAAQTYPLQ